MGTMTEEDVTKFRRGFGFTPTPSEIRVVEEIIARHVTAAHIESAEQLEAWGRVIRKAVR